MCIFCVPPSHSHLKFCANLDGRRRGIFNLAKFYDICFRHIFLFDQLVVMCKKHKTLKFKERLSVQWIDVVDIENDGGRNLFPFKEHLILIFGESKMRIERGLR